MALLEVRDVTLRFGGIVALDGVSFDVEEGQISGLIGPNGAGKTTAFNVITRLYRPDSGDVRFDGVSLLKQPAFKIVRTGVARTFQNIQLFRTMSVLENVLVGAHGRGRNAGTAEALEVLDVVGLRDRAYFPAAALPYGIQKRVELARALATKPRVLLLDEWLSGLSPGELDGGMSVVWSLAAQGIAVILVEHVMTAVRALCSRVVVMNAGVKIAEGPPGEVLRDAEVIRAYLGDDDAA